MTREELRAAVLEVATFVGFSEGGTSGYLLTPDQVDAILRAADEYAGYEPEEDAGGLMLPGEVADAFRVGVGIVGRWEHQGLITSVRTPGGVRRYRAGEVSRLLAGVREGGES